MPIHLTDCDITKTECDAIVAPTDPYYSHGIGIDAQIHAAAGDKLFEECVSKGRLDLGRAVFTKAYGLPCRYVIHTAAPIWINGLYGERRILESCYRSVLSLAKDLGCKNIAIPLLSSDSHGYPKDRIMRVAVDTVSEFLEENEMTVYLICQRDSYEIDRDLADALSSYIEETFVDLSEEKDCEDINISFDLCDFDIAAYERYFLSAMTNISAEEKRKASEAFYRAAERVFENELHNYGAQELAHDVGFVLDDMEMSFSEMLFKFMDQRGINEVECYKRANVDRKTFSKIKCNPNYKPSRATAISLAIALKLDLNDTLRLLETAGMTLSRSNKADVIIAYFISAQIYDINEINETLYKYGQSLLGC